MGKNRLPMIVSVTTLGSTSVEVGRAVAQVVEYLEGVDGRRSAPGSRPQPLAIEGDQGAVGYYADSAERPGIWRGDGAAEFELGSAVDAETFARALHGQHPVTGETLVSAQGSNGRAEHDPASWRRRNRHTLSVADAGELVGVDASYIRRVATRTAAVRAEQEAAERLRMPGPDLPTAFLDGAKSGDGRWEFDRREVERFAESRQPARVVLGYDVTWSAPKSVSMLYARGSDADRWAVEESFEAAVTAGMDYLAAEGFHVRSGRGREKASGMVAASYRHFTNRALEPQLHEHVVITNLAVGSTGRHRAVDARGLFAHATTAGYLAAAELRTQLTARLGVEWAPVHNGVADLAGIDRDAIMAVSSRRKAVLSIAEEMGYDSPAARQTAALATRPSKDRSTDAAELHERWAKVLDTAGFDEAAVERLKHRRRPAPWDADDSRRLFEHLASPEGVTEQAAVFDRRKVLQAVTTVAGDRLSAAEMTDLADHWLATDAVVPLQTDRHRGETIGRGAARVSLAPDEQRYSTPEMLTIEQRTIHVHRSATAAGYGLVDPHLVEAAIKASPIELGADQAAMVRGVCTSGDQFQAVIGRAGAGKTTALSAAAEAWKRADFTVVGAAPFAEAARKLEAETGLKAVTIEALLTRLDHTDPRTVIGGRTVIVVDEASTIGNRQLDRLYRHAQSTGATVRTIGDPHQHRSVEAGGLWKHLTEIEAHRTPVLDTNRRQTGEAMAEVRLALDDYRSGLIAQAMRRLDDDGRIVTASSWDGLLDQMAADWFVDHERHANGEAAPSMMIAERNHDRHALNQRAQALLRSTGQLGDPVTVGDAAFHAGDRIVAQTANRELRAEGAGSRDHVINGSQGTVVAFGGTRREASLVVEFDGLGRIELPHDFVVTEVGPGRGGGVAPAYAVTSYKAEGQTYDTGRNLAAPDAVNTEGMYVALTRGRNDQRTYTIDPAQVRDVPELPVLPDERSATEALTQSLNKHRSADLATVLDPDAARIARNASLPLNEIANARARVLAQERIAAAAINNPDRITVGALGPRPRPGPHRDVWDQAVGEAAVFRARWQQPAVTLSGSVESPNPGDGPAPFDHYDRVQSAVEAAHSALIDRLPLDDLLARRLDAYNQLPDGPKPDPQTAADLLHRLRRDHSDTLQAVSAAEARLELAKTSRSKPWRRPDPEAIDTASTLVEGARSRVNELDRQITRAERLLASDRKRQLARRPLDATITAAERSLDRRINQAVREPAGYLLAVVGPRPKDHNKLEAWNHTARAIETYRHHTGRTPKIGALGRGRIAAAIGPKPDSANRLTAWTNVQKAIHDFDNPKLRERVLRRTM